MTCPGEIELARALSTGGDAELAAHLASCATCRAAWDATRVAIELARELPVAMPSPPRREEMRTAILAAAAGPAQLPARRSWRVPAIVAAAAAGVIGYFATHAASPPSAHTHGTVRPAPGARYVVSAIGPDEVITLSEGELDVEVEPLHPGERFRVVVGGSELEVRGTAFHVAADAERLVEVAVAHGRVDLTPDHGAPATLAAGQAWHATAFAERTRSPSPRAPSAATELREAEPLAEPRDPSAERRVLSAERRDPLAASRVPSTERRDPSAERRDASAASGNPSPSPSAATAIRGRDPSAASRVPSTERRDPLPPAVGRSPSAERRVLSAERRDPLPSAVGRLPSAERRDPLPLPSSRAPDEVAYDDAWAALRSGDFGRAAGSFSRVVLLVPDSPLVEDASFWRAVALARGKRSAEAASAFRDFLDSFARSPRAGQASAMLGWLLIDAGAFDDAARRFTAASGDPDPQVRHSAGAGLDALAQRKR